MTPELHRPLTVDRIADDDITVEADAAECTALAQRMDIPKLHALRCRFQLRALGRGVVLATGELRATVSQICVVSLDPFDTRIRETFRIRFVPAGSESDDNDPESDDEIPYDGAAIDLGEATAEQLALTLDPYPRKPGAELPADQSTPDPSPFAALRPAGEG